MSPFLKSSRLEISFLRSTWTTSSLASASFDFKSVRCFSNSMSLSRVVSVTTPISMAFITFEIDDCTAARSPSMESSWRFLSAFSQYSTVLSAIHSMASSVRQYSLMACATAGSITSRRIFFLSQVCPTRLF